MVPLYRPCFAAYARWPRLSLHEFCAIFVLVDGALSEAFATSDRPARAEESLSQAARYRADHWDACRSFLGGGRCFRKRTLSHALLAGARKTGSLPASVRKPGNQ